MPSTGFSGCSRELKSLTTSHLQAGRKLTSTNPAATSEVAGLLAPDRVLTRATAKRLRNRDPNLPASASSASSEASRGKRPRRESAKLKVKPKVTVVRRSRMAHLEELPLEALLVIVAQISTRDALALFRLCKKLHSRLSGEGAFWRILCHKETFNDYSALKKDDDDKTKRLAYDGTVFHDIRVDPELTKWRKIFLRGIEMRRNVCAGKFEFWRLYLTGEDHLPVKKLTALTTDRELRSWHRKSPFNQKDRHVSLQRYWNEDYLVVIQSDSKSDRFNDVFVWAWDECQAATFLYTTSLKRFYSGFLPMAFFLYKHYLVLMPNNAIAPDADPLHKSVIRVHDLRRNLDLHAAYDFPEDGYVRLQGGNGIAAYEAPHLHKVRDKAVALCRTPDVFRLFVFSLPDCQLLREVKLPAVPNVRGESDLEQCLVDSRFLTRDNVMLFMFYDTEFFENEFTQANGGGDLVEKHGAVVFVDFGAYLGDAAKPIKIHIDARFDSNRDFIEKLSMVSKSRMVCLLKSGKVVTKQMTFDDKKGVATSLEVAAIDPRDDGDDDVGQSAEDADGGGPVLCTGRDGDHVVIMRRSNFDERTLKCYDRAGAFLYCIDLEDPRVGLTKESGFLTVELDGNFVCAADTERIAIWNVHDGRLVSVIRIPGHYRKGKPSVPGHHFDGDHECVWKGHADFAFAEDGIIIVHNKRNFPVAADVLLFW